MAIIPIDETCRIRSDERSWMIEKSKVVKGQRVWNAFLYYETLEEAVSGLIRRRWMMSDAVGFQAVIDELRRVDAEIRGKIKL